jgi:hypothetical protein
LPSRLMRWYGEASSVYIFSTAVVIILVRAPTSVE